MYLLIGILFIAAGLIMLISPETVFQIFESWKGDNRDEPSASYRASTRVGGGAFFIIGIASIIASLLNLMYPSVPALLCQGWGLSGGRPGVLFPDG